MIKIKRRRISLEEVWYPRWENRWKITAYHPSKA